MEKHSNQQQQPNTLDDVIVFISPLGSFCSLSWLLLITLFTVYEYLFYLLYIYRSFGCCIDWTKKGKKHTWIYCFFRIILIQFKWWHPRQYNTNDINDRILLLLMMTKCNVIIRYKFINFVHVNYAFQLWQKHNRKFFHFTAWQWFQLKIPPNMKYLIKQSFCLISFCACVRACVGVWTKKNFNVYCVSVSVSVANTQHHLSPWKDVVKKTPLRKMKSIFSDNEIYFI